MTGRHGGCTVCGAKTVARRLCRAHYQAAWKSGDLSTHAKLPPRVKDPKICPPDHKHAQALTCYNLHQCRCAPCSEHRAETDSRRAKDKAYGRYDNGLVDVAPVREHLLLLGEFGIGYKRVAHLAGIGVTATRNVLWGRQDPGPRHGELPKRIKRETAEALLSVKPDISALAEGTRIPARGTHRRIQALVTQGWTLAKIGRRIGVSSPNMGTLLKRTHVTVRRHRTVAALFDELWNQQPPHDSHRELIAFNRARSFAAERRWLPPLAWDDIDNDPEPPAVDGDDDSVDEIAVELAIAGEGPRLTSAERREAVRRLHRERWSDARIAETIRCADKTVLRIREELELPGWEKGESIERTAA